MGTSKLYKRSAQTMCKVQHGPFMYVNLYASYDPYMANTVGCTWLTYNLCTAYTCPYIVSTWSQPLENTSFKASPKQTHYQQQTHVLIMISGRFRVDIGCLIIVASRFRVDDRTIIIIIVAPWSSFYSSSSTLQKAAEHPHSFTKRLLYTKINNNVKHR